MIQAVIKLVPALALTIAFAATGCGTTCPSTTSAAGDRPLAVPPPTAATQQDAFAVAAALTPYDCRFTDRSITIDGSLDDEAWQTAVDVGPFTLPWLKADARPARTTTRAKLLWDREHLYIAADMDDADVFADVEEHDGNTWDNDVFEIFLKPSVEKPAYYEFHVNAKNTQFDLFLPRRGHVRRFKKDGEFGIESAVKVRGTLNDYTDRDEGWSVEMKIPWASLVRTGGRPEPGDEWRFALCRYDFDIAHERPELSTSAPLDLKDHADFHTFERYAPIRFVSPAPTAAKPFGIPSIMPVTTSKVVGSPEPPLPYRVERAHPQARPSGLITVAHQPGSDRLIFSTEPSTYRPSTLMRMRDDETVFEPEVLIPADDTTVHYAITFHPQFADNGYVFVGSNGVNSPDGRVPEDGRKRTRITRYTIDRDPPYTFHRDSATVVIEWDSNGHNGGDMAFGADGMMYIGSGDGTSDSDEDRVGQDLTTLRSKILRIDPDHPDENTPHDGRHYSVPKDNPIFDAESAIATVKNARPETWAYGLRQPWRLSFDHAHGQLWVANQGQDLWEQIYLIERGANYGWSIVEGSHPFNRELPLGPTPISGPVAEHAHAEARSITGGIVYTGTALPELKGAYLYGDYSTGRIWGIRHDGSQVTWHKLIADTSINITSFGLDSRGELLICDHQPGDAGGFYRLVPTPPKTADQPPFPRKLSESGLFANVSRHRMAAGVVPYEPASQLWSDGTFKARFFALPPATNAAGRAVPTKVGVTNARGWNFPDGTVLIKSFAIDEVEGDPATRRWIETRFMLKEQGEWAGYSYEWNDEQTDAVLVGAAGKDRDYEIRTTDLPADTGNSRTLAWHYPSRTECMVCHSRASNYVLGLCTVQLNRDYDYEAVLGPGHTTDNQLRTLEHLGLLEVNWWGDAMAALREKGIAAGVEKKEAWAWVSRHTKSADPEAGQFSQRRSTLLSRAPAATNRLVNPYDTAHPLEARARSYLQSNCASCHVFAGGGNAQIDLEYMSAYDSRPLEAMKAVGIKPLHTTFDLSDPQLVAAGHPERSVLFARMNRRGPGQMPQLATTVIDEKAVALMREWIESLAPAEDTVSQR